MIEHSTRPDASWDERVRSTPSGSYYQASIFADYYRCLADLRPHYLVLRRADGTVRGQLLALEGSRGGARLRSWPQPLREAARLTLRSHGSYLIWLQGPLVFLEEDTEACVRELVVAAANLAERSRLGSVSGYPSPYGPQRGRAFSAFRESASAVGFTLGVNATYVLELADDEATLWSGIRSEARTKVRRAERDGIRVVKCDDERDFERFLGPVLETNRRTGIGDPYRRRRFNCFWQVTRPAGFSHFFLSERDGHVLSAQHALLYNGIVILSGVSYTDVSRERHLYGNDLVQWHVMRWASSVGARYIDWAGAAVVGDEPTSVDAFKAKWGGERVELPVLFCGAPVDAARVAQSDNDDQPRSPDDRAKRPESPAF